MGWAQAELALLPVPVGRVLWLWTPEAVTFKVVQGLGLGTPVEVSDDNAHQFLYSLRNHSLQMNVSKYFPDPTDGHCNGHA